MRLVAALLLLLAASCTERKTHPFDIPVQGEAHSLRFENGMLTFCDGRGGRKVDLKTAKDSASDRACPKPAEPNGACSGLKLDVSVRSPASEPDDIVDVKGTSFPLKGRVHDCAGDGNLIVAVTGSQAVLIDAAKGAARELGQQGSDRAAIGAGWAAWTEGTRMRLAPVN